MTASAEEIAWAAGFFEGEGTFSINNQRGKRYTCAQIQNCDHELLVRFQEIVGIGKVRGPYHPSGAEPVKRNLSWWAWRVSPLDDVKQVAELLWPWLGQRRKEQFQRCMREDTRAVVR